MHGVEQTISAAFVQSLIDDEALALECAVDRLGVAWSRVHNLARGMGEPWVTFDAILLESFAIARGLLR